ncbi:hypothetical protein ACFVJ5_22320 [Nocardia sp. NPDC127606]|uniref:hypothetical protein n=1 Tax=Nocardia sp. NPDC127606 TaxID=3345406 RepID=UPI00364164E3
MRTPQRVASIVAIPLVTLAVFGCSTAPSDSNSQERTSSVSNELRRDPEPMQKYFPIIGKPVEVFWLGRNNASGAPGLTTYWVEAVVELEPDTAAALRTGLVAQAQPPALPDVLRTEVPAGSYVTGPEFDTALGGSAEWNGTATGYLHTEKPILVFTATSGG